MSAVTKDMLMGDILAINNEIAVILMRSGMHCVGCPSSRSESLEDACQVHGVNADLLVDEINKFLGV